jgi:hypothetical protein
MGVGNPSKAGMNVLSPRPLLKMEGLGVLAGACFAYPHLAGSWLLFGVLFLTPDVSILGYALGTRAGAWTYNTVHTYLAPLLVGLAAYATDSPKVFPVCVIWAAHIGFDRLLGFGLKYADSFKETHLGRV